MVMYGDLLTQDIERILYDVDTFPTGHYPKWIQMAIQSGNMIINHGIVHMFRHPHIIPYIISIDPTNMKHHKR